MGVAKNCKCFFFAYSFTGARLNHPFPDNIWIYAFYLSYPVMYSQSERESSRKMQGTAFTLARLKIVPIVAAWHLPPTV